MYYLNFIDPRSYQILVLSALLAYGLAMDLLDVSLFQLTLTITSVLITQYLCTVVFRVERYEPRSALISGLSLALLFRSSSLMLVVLAAFITVSSKFTLRYRNKHIFNPTNLGIGVLLLLDAQAWISPGQWGAAIFFAAVVSCLGIIVVYRARRSDVTFAFLVSYVGLLIFRAFRLGDPLGIPLHQISNISFVIFTFFMISDPRTTPNSRIARIIFAGLVAYLSFHIRFTYYNPNALIYALLFCSVLTPLLDHIFKDAQYRWPGRVDCNRGSPVVISGSKAWV